MLIRPEFSQGRNIRKNGYLQIDVFWHGALIFGDAEEGISQREGGGLGQVEQQI